MVVLRLLAVLAAVPSYTVAVCSGTAAVFLLLLSAVLCSSQCLLLLVVLLAVLAAVCSCTAAVCSGTAAVSLLLLPAVLLVVVLAAPDGASCCAG